MTRPYKDQTMTQPKRTFTFTDGTEVEIQDVPSLVLEHILNSEAGKPPVPIVEVTMARGHKRKQPNPQDPDYIAAVNAWNGQKQKRLLMYLVTKGVKDEPPPEFVEEYEQYLPDGASLEELKYLWLAEKLDGEDEIGRFTEALMSQTAVTKEGLEEAAAIFPGDGERGADTGLGVQETAVGSD